MPFVALTNINIGSKVRLAGHPVPEAEEWPPGVLQANLNQHRIRRMDDAEAGRAMERAEAGRVMSDCKRAAKARDKAQREVRDVSAKIASLKGTIAELHEVHAKANERLVAAIAVLEEHDAADYEYRPSRERKAEIRTAQIQAARERQRLKKEAEEIVAETADTKTRNQPTEAAKLRVRLLGMTVPQIRENCEKADIDLAEIDKDGRPKKAELVEFVARAIEASKSDEDETGLIEDDGQDADGDETIEDDGQDADE